MRERITARVLLFDPELRVLLMKGRFPSNPDAPGVWFTIGGGAKPGETVMQAAAREIVEETGFLDVRLEDVVWRREAVYRNARQEPVLFKESYVLAHCHGGEPSRAGWQVLEQNFIDDMRWWTLDEIAATQEPFVPEGFADLLKEILEGGPPAVPRVLTP